MTPTLELEESYFGRGCSVVAGVDEVGRGSLAGPVSVGIVAIRADTAQPPAGVQDSKVLTAGQRESLISSIRRWALACAVGHASAAEIDHFGLSRALRLAGERARISLLAGGVRPAAIILDGSHDWLGPSRLETRERQALIVTRVRADSACGSVAAASIIAKVTRDAHLVQLDRQCPQYGWAGNKGYATASHRRALGSHGPSYWHRRSWRLPAREAEGSEAS